MSGAAWCTVTDTKMYRPDDRQTIVQKARHGVCVMCMCSNNTRTKRLNSSDGERRSTTMEKPTVSRQSGVLRKLESSWLYHGESP